MGSSVLYSLKGVGILFFIFTRDQTEAGFSEGASTWSRSQ